MRIRKVFAYITLHEGNNSYLLAFESLDEPGYEVPKGQVEPGENLQSAVHREVQEESGLTDLEIIKELGTTTWEDQDQTFFWIRTQSAKRVDFDHQVTGNDLDEGFLYQYTWLEIDSRLKRCLVQGCDRFIDHLISAF